MHFGKKKLLSSGYFVWVALGVWGFVRIWWIFVGAGRIFVGVGMFGLGDFCCCCSLKVFKDFFSQWVFS